MISNVLAQDRSYVRSTILQIGRDIEYSSEKSRQKWSSQEKSGILKKIVYRIHENGRLSHYGGGGEGDDMVVVGVFSSADASDRSEQGHIWSDKVKVRWVVLDASAERREVG
jgi:hypothetical protein